MPRVLGGTLPQRLGRPANTDATFPDLPGDYVSPDGAIVIPGGSLNRFFNFRAGRGVSKRGDVLLLSDSTGHGSGGLYALTQQWRDRAVGWGMADGGKGMFAGGEGISGSPIQYDSPEINGFVSTTFVGSPDGYDNLDGQYYYDTGASANHTLVLQFRQTGARLWYSARPTASDFTYSVDGGGVVTVNASNGSLTNKYVTISGLAANTTHTLTITNMATVGLTECWIALAPINDTGIAFQKFATSGDRIYSRLYRGVGAPAWTTPTGGLRYQTPFGLVPGDRPSTSTPPYTGAARDTSWADINPVLAIWHLGFNDLTTTGTSFTDGSDLPMWTEYVKIAAGTCYDADCDCLIVSGQLPYNQYWPTYGPDRFNAMKTQAAASGVGFVDLFQPVAGPSLSYSGGTGNPHLTKAQYQAQADYLWDNLLGA